MIHTVKGFGIVSKAEIDVFLELFCFFNDPADVGNLISGSSAFSKTSLNIWKFTVHVLLKPGLENFEHYFTSMWNECWVTQIQSRVRSRDEHLFLGSQMATYSLIFCYCCWLSCPSLSHVWLSATPWTAACQAFLSFTISWSLLRLMSIESVMPPNHFILCHPLLLLSSIFPSIKVFSKESAHHTRWPKYWSFSFSISPSKEYSGLI